MFSLIPTLDDSAARISLRKILNTDFDPKLFHTALRNLHTRFNAYAENCPAPFIAPGLIVTPEIRRQSEAYLPIAEIARVFNRLYRNALTYEPVLSSSPFSSAMSWADLFVALPPGFRFSPNPARVLDALLSDNDLLIKFLFASFLPRRFYGGFYRYPGQMGFIRKWLGERLKSGSGGVRCLDAACGTGENSYAIAKLLMEFGVAPEEIHIEGWTLEPLEVWVASHSRFPHDKRREERFRRESLRLHERGYSAGIRFRCADLSETCPIPLLQKEREIDPGQFDLIICNGLLGGPIINRGEGLERVVSNLAGMLASGGILLATDSFHGGWKSKCRSADLEELFQKTGLEIVEAGEGIGALKLNS